jgi:hypothetical protein
VPGGGTSGRRDAAAGAGGDATPDVDGATPGAGGGATTAGVGGAKTAGVGGDEGNVRPSA